MMGAVKGKGLRARPNKVIWERAGWRVVQFPGSPDAYAWHGYRGIAVQVQCGPRWKTAKGWVAFITMTEALHAFVTEERLQIQTSRKTDTVSPHHRRKSPGLKPFQERFRKWKGSVLPANILEVWCSAQRACDTTALPSFKAVLCGAAGFKKFMGGDDKAYPKALGEVKAMRSLLLEAGVKCPRWRNPPRPGKG